jgi:hypothetical protein
MELSEWISLYQPNKDSDGNLVSYDVVEDVSFIDEQDESFVWTEMWNSDSELPLLYPGCVPDDGGGLQWFVCKNPWSGDSMDLIVFLDSEDWNS